MFFWQKIGALDERIAFEQPFKVVKEDKLKAETMIPEMVLELGGVGRWLAPLMPTTSGIILDAIANNKKPENLFVRLPV